MLARVVSAFVDERLSILAYYGIVFAFDMILGLLASLVLMRFSRHREYHADAGAAQFMGSPIAMIGALRSLEKAFAARKYDVKENAVSHLMIFGEAKKRLRSHPTTEQRIRALESGQYSSGV
jgi:heat shock protein HtpX